jgi:MFS family permease
VEVWQVLVLSLFLGIINAFDIPARQSFVVEVVDDRQDLGNAIALNSALFNSARIIGPSVAGLAIAMIGEGLCFLFNGLAHGATVVALLLMKLQPRPRKALSGHIFRQLIDGMSYAWQAQPIRALLLILCLTSFAGWPIMMIMPVFVGKILSGGPQTLGLLFTVFGFGALLATAWLASRRHTGGLERIIIRGGILFSLGLMVFSQSSWLWLSMVTIFVSGFGMVAQAASINTMLQTLVEEEKRGRLMSLYVMAFGGTVPLGSLAYGQVAAQIGAPMTVLAGAILCLIGTAAFRTSLPSWQADAKRRLDENLL